MAKIIYRKYGWKRDLPDQRDRKYMIPAHIGDASLPNQVDLRAKMPPIRNQNELGICTGMAIAADCHSQMIIQGGKTWTPSPMFIYYNERLLENTVMQDSGAEIRDGMKAINRWGICSEDKCPYEISKFRVKPSRAAYADGAKHKIFNYARIGQSLLQLQSALANNDPFVFGFSVYESFESDQVAKTGIMPMPSQRENLLGGHAVLCCGFFNNTKTFLVRNSWGTDWGQQGYFHMPYDFILNENLAADFWSVKYVPS